MAKLKMAERKALPPKDFAVPSKRPGSGSFPIPDESHAEDAMARASGKPEADEVDEAVAKKFPEMGATKPRPPWAPKAASSAAPPEPDAIARARNRK